MQSPTRKTHTRNTHTGIDPRLCGTVVQLDEGLAVVRLATTQDMVVDDRGLVHGGFIFGLADHAAMLAVNDPLVVLGAAQTRFVKPVKRGETVTAVARIVANNGRKHTVGGTVSRGGVAVMLGTFTWFVLQTHVLGGVS